MDLHTTNGKTFTKFKVVPNKKNLKSMWMRGSRYLHTRATWRHFRIGKMVRMISSMRRSHSIHSIPCLSMANLITDRILPKTNRKNYENIMRWLNKLVVRAALGFDSIVHRHSKQKRQIKEHTKDSRYPRNHK